MPEAARPGRAPLSTRSKRSAVRPGLWGGLLTASLSGAACWFLMAPGLAAGTLFGFGALPSRLEEVRAEEVTPALSTLSGSAGVLDRLRRRECQALAVVTLVAPPGTPPAKVRLRSGAYDSPPFTLSAAPVRVAIPYPAPLPSGRGVISVFSDGGQAVVALSPPQHLPIPPGVSSLRVWWQPRAACEGPSG